jgi:hypothetical protein
LAAGPAEGVKVALMKIAVQHRPMTNDGIEKARTEYEASREPGDPHRSNSPEVGHDLWLDLMCGDAGQVLG